MAGVLYEKGQTICSFGKPMTELFLIAKGQVSVKYPGGKYRLDQGDVCGICEVCSEVHFLEYVAAETTTVMSYPLNSLEALEEMLQNNGYLSKLFLVSAFRQISTLLNQSSLSGLNCNSIYRDLADDYEAYQNLCRGHGIAYEALSSIEEVGAYLGDDAPDYWLNTLYSGLAHICSSENAKVLLEEAGVPLGMLRKCSLDFRRTYTGLEEQYQYLKKVMHFYLNSTEKDLFGLYTNLYYQIGNHSEQAEDLYGSINRMILQLQEFPFEDETLVEKRTEAFFRKAALMDTSASPETAAGSSDTADEAGCSFSNALHTILEFAGASESFYKDFADHVIAYRSLADKFSSDDDAALLRKQLTEEFYRLYSDTFVHSLSAGELPIAVKMFLYFGFVDEALAGKENTQTLSKLARTITHREGSRVYTMYHWLLAIYEGSKLPSRNEFDIDYTDYLHKVKLEENLSSSEIQAMANDSMAKVMYELQNMFPPVNKMTFGRISNFCPILIAENLLKSPAGCLVSEEAVIKALQIVKRVDYSAFYRETLDTEHIKVMGKEPIHAEYLPDVILMPNAGIRGVMWQEIEGRVRTSPSRMILSIFHMEDITTTFIRLTGEFRWEMCKRIQGSRWNDVTDRSLTSEYFDYVQFYKKNHDLTSEAKERVRTNLQRVKNSFKEMFVRDYIIWIMYEGNSAPRLNKVARRILFTYCPFPREITVGLVQNPLYTEVLHAHKIRTAQKLHLLHMLQKKLSASGIAQPDTLLAEIEFYEKTAIE